MSPRHDDDRNFADQARQRAIESYEQARDNVAGASKKARESLSDSPLLALAGGIAAGALIAALLPRTDKETELVGPTAKRVKQTARAAADAARETARKASRPCARCSRAWAMPPRRQPAPRSMPRANAEQRFH